MFNVFSKLTGTTPTPDPAAPPAPKPDGPQWYCLRSQLNGRFCTANMRENEDGQFEMAGPFMLFMDGADAEREAVAHRETFPWLLVRAEPLPASPPEVCRPRREKDETVIATQVYVSRGDEHVTAEIRTQAMTDSAELAADLLGRIVAFAGSLPSTRVGPVRVVTLGPRGHEIGGNAFPVAGQPTPDQEAA